MPRKVFIIANPVAGGGRGRGLAERLERALRAEGLAVETRLTTREHNGQALAQEIAPGECDTLAVVGGDGSVHDVLGGLRDLSTPIALLPAGTANVWARQARLPWRPEGTARLIRAGRTVRARLFTGNGERFFLFAGAGIDARIVDRVEGKRARRGHQGGMLRWFVPGYREFFGRPLAELSVTAEGQRLDGLAEVLVTRVRGYAAFLRLAPGIDIADDLLHVIAIPRQSKVALLALAAEMVVDSLRAGRHGITVLATDGPVRIEARGSEPFHLDGNPGGQLPLEIEPTALHALLVIP